MAAFARRAGRSICGRSAGATAPASCLANPGGSLGAVARLDGEILRPSVVNRARGSRCAKGLQARASLPRCAAPRAGSDRGVRGLERGAIRVARRCFARDDVRQAATRALTPAIPSSGQSSRSSSGGAPRCRRNPNNTSWRNRGRCRVRGLARGPRARSPTRGSTSWASGSCGSRGTKGIPTRWRASRARCRPRCSSAPRGGFARRAIRCRNTWWPARRSSSRFSKANENQRPRSHNYSAASSMWRSSTSGSRGCSWIDGYLGSRGRRRSSRRGSRPWWKRASGGPFERGGFSIVGSRMGSSPRKSRAICACPRARCAPSS